MCINLAVDNTIIDVRSGLLVSHNHDDVFATLLRLQNPIQISKSMDIRNPIQFTNFIMGHGLKDSSPQIALVCKCVEDYNKMCGNCQTHSEDIKKKMGECMNLYVLAVMASFPNITKVVMSKAIMESSITFYKEGKHIKTITR